MGLDATHFPRSAPGHPSVGEDGDAYQRLMQLTWAPGFDQSRPLQDGEDLWLVDKSFRPRQKLI